MVIVVGRRFVYRFFDNKLDFKLDYSNIVIVVFFYFLVGIVGLIEGRYKFKLGYRNVELN